MNTLTVLRYYRMTVTQFCIKMVCRRLEGESNTNEVAVRGGAHPRYCRHAALALVCASAVDIDLS